MVIVNYICTSSHLFHESVNVSSRAYNKISSHGAYLHGAQGHA